MSRQYPPLTVFRVTYRDNIGNIHSDVHNMAAGITIHEAKEHYIGTKFMRADDVNFDIGIAVEQLAVCPNCNSAGTIGVDCPNCPGFSFTLSKGK